MKFFIFPLLIISICATAQGQILKLAGNIKDQSGEAVSFANVLFTDMNDSTHFFGTLCDVDGHFIIDLPKLHYALEVSFVGAKTKITELDLRFAKSDKDLGELIIDTELILKEVVVRSNTDAYRIALDKKVYDVSKDLANNGGKLIDVIENTPSVQVDVDGNINIRGNGSVRILVDGKMSGIENTGTLLRTLPAGSISKIEVITNPSSKYEAEGSGGIINVVLNKSKQRQLRSSVEIFSGIRLNAGTNINLNQKNEHYSWYVNSGIGYSAPKTTNHIHTQIFNEVPMEYFQDAELIRKPFYFSNKLGGTLKLNDQNTITTDITLRTSNANNRNEMSYRDFISDTLAASSERIDQQNNEDQYLQLSTSYELKLNDEGAKIKLGLLSSISQEDGRSNIVESLTYPDQSISANDLIRNEVNDKRYNLSVDYVSSGKNDKQLEFGFRNRNTLIKNDFSVERIEENTTILIPEFTDQTTYKENILAFYGQYAQSYQKFKYQVGLRTETSAIDILSKQNTVKSAQGYTNLFPSAFFDYQLNEDNSLRLSVSRRIERPRRNAITPFNSFSNARNVFAGNPAINPSYVVMAELGYQSHLGERLSITPTLFYKNTTDVMHYFTAFERLTFNGEAEDVLVTRTVNIGDNTIYGLEISTSYDPNRWLKIFNEINFNSFKQKGIYQNRSYNSRGLFIYGRLNFNFTLSETIKFQVQNRFANGRKRGQIKSSGIYRMDLGLSKDLMQHKASLTLNFKDLFDSWVWHVQKESDLFIQNIERQVRVPQFNISFIYRFNQKKDAAK